jgi:uncharacterized protein (TIGR00369 family)
MTDPRITLTPYAETIGITVDRWEGGSPVLALDYGTDTSGNPGTFHGGVIAGLLEMAGLAALEAQQAARGDAVAPRSINTTIEYLRSAVSQRLYAAGTVVRAGRRLSNVRVEAWQDDAGKPVATAVLNIIPA